MESFSKSKFFKKNKSLNEYPAGVRTCFAVISAFKSRWVEFIKNFDSNIGKLTERSELYSKTQRTSSGLLKKFNDWWIISY